jgi:hypothetical protein
LAALQLGVDFRPQRARFNLIAAIETVARVEGNQ